MKGEPPCRSITSVFEWVKAYYGGNWNNGALDGLFCLNVNNAASNVNTSVGGRLAND